MGAKVKSDLRIFAVSGGSWNGFLFLAKQKDQPWLIRLSFHRWRGGWFLFSYN